VISYARRGSKFSYLTIPILQLSRNSNSGILLCFEAFVCPPPCARMEFRACHFLTRGASIYQRSRVTSRRAFTRSRTFAYSHRSTKHYSSSRRHQWASQQHPAATSFPSQWSVVVPLVNRPRRCHCVRRQANKLSTDCSSSSVCRIHDTATTFGQWWIPGVRKSLEPNPIW
jgi:hypothetical protein